MRFLCLIIFTLWLWSAEAVAGEFVSKPQIAADAAILIEAKGGRVIYEKNADERRYPASMTKIMTCLLALETLPSDSTVFVSPLAASAEDSFLGLQAGDSLKTSELLKGLMLVSDNAAAVALAEGIDGSVAKFAQRMNERAAALGCRDTHFNNPNGLPDADHYSTAHDMADIAAFAMRRADFQTIVGTKQDSALWLIPAGRFAVLENTNDLLSTYDGATGIKTGWTNAAGGCLAASAKQGSLCLIAVVMHSADADTRFTDAAKLLDYGFAVTKIKPVMAKERIEQKIWVRDGLDFSVLAEPAEDICYPMLTGEKKEDFSVSYELPKIISAPVAKGDKVGEVIIRHKQELVGKIDILAKEDVGAGFSVLSYLIGRLAHIFGIA